MPDESTRQIAMKTHKFLKFLIVTLSWFLFGAIYAFAASASAVTQDYTVLGGALAALITIVVPFIVEGVKKLTPKIPTWLIPIIAAVVGVLLSLPTLLFPGDNVTWWQGLICGLGGVGLREIQNQWVKPPKTVEENAAQPSVGENLN